MMNKSRIKYFESLILWDKAYMYDIFDYFLNEEFNKERQSYLKNSIFSSIEYSMLLDIHKKMNLFFDECEDVWNIDLKDKKITALKEKIDKFLNLASMKEEVREYKKNHPEF